ncbi:hypothetical protein FRC09_002669 [Ceratobasidium sp. 395]|nr:hypothetical protein FRC09_002669 [Ceratobasidium sp. 395]
MKACLGVKSHVKQLHTETGVKDCTTQSLIMELIKRGREIQQRIRKSGKPATDELIMTEQLAWLKAQPAEPFNVLLKIHGLDPHRDTPVKILHTILLGVEKYAWHYFHTSVKEAKLPLFATRLQSSSITGLGLNSFSANYIVKYPNNLIGRHFKTLMQLTAFHVYDIVSPDLFTLLKAVGSFDTVLWIPAIEDLELYLPTFNPQADLTILINNVLDAFAHMDPGRIISKVKLHILTHLVDDIQNHGPAVRNHQAPSRDICNMMKELEGFRHIATGGFSHDNYGNPVCASTNVQHFFQSNLQLQSYLGWIEPKPITPGLVELVPMNVQKELSWEQTRACLCNPDILFALNTQHDCHMLSCTASAAETVRQEHTNTTIERQAIQHNPTRIYLVNMHVLNNADLLQKVLPRSLIQPVPLQSAEAHIQSMAEHANQYHKEEEAKRVASKKKQKEIKEAKAREAEAEAAAREDAKVLLVT